MKVKAGGGLAGHNGLRSIATTSHPRLPAGPRSASANRRRKEHGADHVLKRPSKAMKTELEIAVQEAADAVEMIIEDGVDRAMNRFNTSLSG